MRGPKAINRDFVPRRRKLLSLATALVLPKQMCAVHAAAADDRSSAPLHGRYAAVIPGYTLRFPADEGSHPEFRVEWWYVTGWLDIPQREAVGFQVTFFRARPQ